MSARASTCEALIRSGAMYRAVPYRTLAGTPAGAATPKSVIFTRRPWPMMMLPGLMSRWTMPARCTSASPAATRHRIWRTALGSTGSLWLASVEAMVCPSTYSMTTNTPRSSSISSWMTITSSQRRRASRRAISRKRSR